MLMSQFKTLSSALVRGPSRVLGAIALALLPVAIASGQDLTVKAPAPTRDTWIINATIHTVSDRVIQGGSVQLRTDGTIGEILESRPGMDAEFARRHTVIDATGLHVYPGLVSANTQLGLAEVLAARATIDTAEAGDVTPEVRAAVAVNPDSTLLPVTRSNGVLSAAVMPLGGLIPGRPSVIELEGWTWEDMATDDAIGMLVNWPGMRVVRGAFVTEKPEEQKKRIARALDAIDGAFRTAKAYIAAKAQDPGVPTDLRWEAMRGVLEGGDPVFVRAEELEQIQSAVSWGAGLGLKMVIIGGRDASACVDLLKRHDAAVIIAGTQRFPKRDDSPYDEPFVLPQTLERAGVRWCLASGGPNDEPAHERSMPYHAAMAVAFGLDEEVALRSITLAPAQILGVGDRLGSIQSGKHATLMVTDGSPLELNTKIRYAFIRGRAIDLSNKQTALDAKYREKYRQLGITPGAK